MYHPTPHTPPYPTTNAIAAQSSDAVVPASIDLHLDWIGALGRTSCPLETVWRDPSLTRGIAGVYLIWSTGGMAPAIVYVGSGRDIGALLQAQHDDPRITGHACSGELHVSWAAVASLYRAGVAQYLKAALSPLIAEAIPAARPVSVNLPV